MNDILQVKRNVKTDIEQLMVGDVVTSNPTIICNKINSFFSSFEHELDSKLQESNVTPLRYLHGHFPTMNLTPTTSDEITKIIRQLKDSCPGHDGVHIKVLKLSTHVLSSKLKNNSFQRDMFPNNLEIAKIISIYKSGDILQPSNYRPTSISQKFVKS